MINALREHGAEFFQIFIDTNNLKTIYPFGQAVFQNNFTIKRLSRFLTFTGNGFLFKTFDSGGLFWAIDQAMHFYMLPIKEKEQQINRIMLQSACRFNHRVTAQHYIDLYEKMLQRPLINPENTESREMNKNSGKKGKRSINPIFTRD